MDKTYRSELQRKERRRLIEYLSLTIVYFVLFFLSTPLLQPPFSFGCSLLGGTIGWVLSQQRERRRLLAPQDRKRLIADILENLFSLLILALILLIAILTNFPLPALLGYLSATLWSYFLATAAGERTWQHRFLPHLPSTQQLNYLTNLSPTIFFPLNLYRK